MKVKFFALSTGFLAVFSSLFAQYADLLDDDNVTWVAEYTTDFNLNPVNYVWDSYGSNYNSVSVMQFSIEPSKHGLYQPPGFNEFFSKKILETLKKGSVACFADESLEVPLSQAKILELLSPTDTITDPYWDVFKDTTYIIQRNLSAENLIGFRVRQVFYFDKANRLFGSRVLALAPLVGDYDDLGNMVDYKPLAWIKIEPPPKNWNKIAPEEVTYAIETNMQGNAPFLENFVLKKGRMDFLQLIVNEIASPTLPILAPDFNTIDPSKLRDFVLVTDTVTTFSPETLEEKIEIVQRNLIKDVESIGFVQRWLYDERKKMFFNRVVAIAPRIAVKDAEGDLRYTRVLFYLINK
jgi:hypothetical protein